MKSNCLCLFYLFSWLSILVMHWFWLLVVLWWSCLWGYSLLAPLTVRLLQMSFPLHTSVLRTRFHITACWSTFKSLTINSPRSRLWFLFYFYFFQISDSYQIFACVSSPISFFCCILAEYVFSKRTNIATDKSSWSFFRFMKHNFYSGYNLIFFFLFCMQYEA